MKKKMLVTLIFTAIAGLTLTFAVVLSSANNRQQIFYSCCPFKEEEIDSISFLQKDGSSLSTQDTELITEAFDSLCMLDTVTHQSTSQPPEGLYTPIVITLQDGKTVALSAEYNFIEKKLGILNQYFQFKNANDLYTLSQEYYAMLENNIS